MVGLISEWELGGDTTGSMIWLKIKGRIDTRFCHTFIRIDEAEELANNILEVTRKMKGKSVGQCCQCKGYIANKDKYYELENKKIIHKNCIGEFLENNIIEKKLIPKIATEYDPTQINCKHIKRD